MNGTIRSVAFGVCASLVASLALIGCGSGNRQSGASLPPIDDTRSGMSAPMPASAPPRPGMSTRTKVALLVGAAALYYMYRKNKASRAQGDRSQPQYYLSKNGRVYYRDQSGQAHWVTPPPQGIQVPMAEAQPYRRLQGYNNGNGMSLQELMNNGGAAVDDPYAGSGAGAAGGYGGGR